MPSKGREIQLCHMLLEASSDRDDGARGCLSWVLEARQGLVTHGEVQGDRGTNEACPSFKRTVSGRKQQQAKKRKRSTKNGGKRQMLRTARNKATPASLPSHQAATEPVLTHQHDEICHGLVHRAPVHARMEVFVTALHLDGNRDPSICC